MPIPHLHPLQGRSVVGIRHLGFVTYVADLHVSVYTEVFVEKCPLTVFLEKAP